jgi:hypothetical protein
MMTTTHNNTDINTAQRKRTAEQEERLCNRWGNRVVGALFRKLKREVRAANALFGTLEWVFPDLVAMWFMPGEEADVTRHAALAEECLNDARAHAKRKERALAATTVPTKTFISTWFFSVPLRNFACLRTAGIMESKGVHRVY